MSSPLRIVGVSGSPSAPSRTSTLVRATLDRFSVDLPTAEITAVEVAPLLPDLGQAADRSQMSARTAAALEAVESADLLVVGSPAFRAAYSGAFKLFFDWVGQYSLVDTPVLLTSTGGSDRHALMVEHQLRPLFAFFQSVTLPLAVYANERDFRKHDGSYTIDSVDLELRVDQAVARALPILGGARAVAPSA